MANPDSITADVSSNSSTSILSEKVSRALQVRTDTPAMKAALDALSHTTNNNTDSIVDARSVRVAIEHDALQQALLLQAQLRVLVTTVQDLRVGVSECASIAHRVKDAIHMNVISANTNNKNNTINVEASVTVDALEQEQALALTLSDAFAHTNASRKRATAVAAFLETFDLSQQDSRLLDQYAFAGDLEEDGMAFLRALEGVRTIRVALTKTFHDTSDLEDRSLGASSALRMMESLAQKQERAQERLYHWLQTYTIESSDEVLQHPFVKRALFTLRHVPAFYTHTLELVANSRRAEETRRFLLALTSGYNGLPPMEMKSHDAVAYIGDMLAFAFKAFSMEADVAQDLLVYRPEETHDGNHACVQDDAADDPLTENLMVDKPITAKDMLFISMSGLARPLMSRILQVISTLARRHDDEDDRSDDGMHHDEFEEEGHLLRSRLTHLYEICGLLLFYTSAMDKIVRKMTRDGTGCDESQSLSHIDDTQAEATADDQQSSQEKNPLVGCLLECLKEGTNAYEATIRVYSTMMEQLSATTGESHAALAHSMLVRLADVRMNSPGFSQDVVCPKDFVDTLSIEWATKTLVVAALNACTSLDDAVALQLSVVAAKKAGMSVVAAEKLDKAIDAKEADLVEGLVADESSKVLDLCGLGNLSKAWRSWQSVRDEETLMSLYPGLSHEDVEAGIKEFYASLYSPPFPSLETLVKDPVLRRTARSKIAASVCDTYAGLYESILQGGYDDVSFLGHTPDQVTTLFSL
jgi:hypothetical protein